MNTILKSITFLFLALSLSVSAQAAGSKGFKTEEIKKFKELVEKFGIEGVKFNGMDELVNIRPELRSSMNELLKQMESKPEFFKNNKEAVTKLLTAINGATGAAFQVLSKESDGQGGIKVPSTVPENRAAEVKMKAEDILKACEALPGSLATLALGKNGDLPRLQNVAETLSRVNRNNIFKESVESDVLAKNLTGTEKAPKTVDDIRFLVEKALNENRTDGKTFTLEDLIKACLEAMRKA